MLRIAFHASLLTLLLILPASSQQRWERTYGGTGSDYGSSAQQTTDGGYIVAGYSDSYGDYVQVYLIKTDAYGDTSWTRTYGGTRTDIVYSVRQTQEGGYIIAGVTNSFGKFGQVYLIKTNDNGDTLWSRTYGGTDLDEGYSVQQTNDGGYIVAGVTRSFGAIGLDVYLIKTNASGDTLWTRIWGGTNDDYGNSVQQTTDGGYIVAGTTYYFRGADGLDSDVLLIKTNASGDTLWTKTYGGTSWEYGQSVQQTLDGGYIIAGSTFSYGAGCSAVYLIKTDASGNTLWTRIYGGTEYDYGYSVRQTSDGGYIIAGGTSSFGAGLDDVYLIKTDANGNAGGSGPGGGGGLKAIPNPFVSYAWVPGHLGERFALYDIAGRKVGTYKGDRIGEGLGAGVYFLRPSQGSGTTARLVKLR